MTEEEYAQHVYGVIKSNTVGFDTVYEGYISYLVGVDGLAALQKFGYVETCGIVDNQQLYVLFDGGK